MTTFKHYIQEWEGYKRIIIVANEGSCFIEICKGPVYAELKGEVKAEIWGINICPQYRNKGYGKQLLTYAENLLRQLGETAVSIERENYTPKWVLSWYKNSGYEVKRNFDDVDIILTKNLIIEKD